MSGSGSNRSVTTQRCSVITQTEICFSEQSNATYCFRVALLGKTIAGSDRQIIGRHMENLLKYSPRRKAVAQILSSHTRQRRVRHHIYDGR
jgi:hypothetical protein